MTKMWCLSCEHTFEIVIDVPLIIPNNYLCLHCNSGWMDIEECLEEGGFFRQAYPNLEYDEIIVNKYYPLYPKE